MGQGNKAVTYYIGMGALWLISTEFFVLFYSRFSQTPIYYSTAAFATGLAAWAVVGWVMAKKSLRSIENPPAPKGVASFKRFMLVVASFLLVGSLSMVGFVFLVEYLRTWFFLFSFIGALVPSLYFGSAAAFWRWQLKTRRVLYVKNGILFPSPVDNIVDYNETIY